jgi:hypothetical protein
VALRSSLTRPTLFLARRLSEMRINSYNKEILEMTRANMDIQFCLDPYAAATYVASYMMKGQRGMSKAMSAACSKARAENLGIKEVVRHMENVFSRASEVSAQEAVYHCLGLPFRRSSRACKFVPTSPPTHRTFMARQDRDLKNLDNDSTDIAYSSVVNKYANRPSELHPLSLAEFVAWYEPIRPPTVAPEEVDDENPDANEDMFFPSETAANPGVHIVEEALTEDGVEAPAYKKRKRPKIIRYVRYSLAKDPDNYYRELLLLFHPWNSEDKLQPQDLNAVENDILLDGHPSFKSRYLQVEDVLVQVRRDFEKNEHRNWEEVEAEGKRVFEEHENLLDEFVVAPNMQQGECDIEAEGIKKDPALDEHVGHQDFGVELNIKTANNSMIKVVNISRALVDDSTYFGLVRKLNVEQQLFFNHVMYSVHQASEVQLKCFLTGGAGMGKSVLTSALFQSLTRWYNDQLEIDKSTMKVLVMAPTGAAAFEVSGMTLHSALSIPTQQSLHEYRFMDSSKLSEMRSDYKDLKAVFFDEVSLVGKTMLAFVDQRLRQFTGKNNFMGGLHVIFVGDLFQLKPVKDGYVFEELKSGFNALGGKLWADNVVMYELYEQMRQKDATVFADRLNRLREGEQTPEDIAFFETLVIDRNNPRPEHNLFIKHLSATNKELDAHNALVYDRSNSLALVCRARDTFLARSLTVSRRQILTKVLNSVLPKTFYGLHQTLNLRVGLMVEVVLNEDVSDGIFNGAYGHLRSVTLNENDVSSRLWVEFAN